MAEIVNTNNHYTETYLIYNKEEVYFNGYYYNDREVRNLMDQNSLEEFNKWVENHSNYKRDYPFSFRISLKKDFLRKISNNYDKFNFFYRDKLFYVFAENEHSTGINFIMKYNYEKDDHTYTPIRQLLELPKKSFEFNIMKSDEIKKLLRHNTGIFNVLNQCGQDTHFLSQLLQSLPKNEDLKQANNNRIQNNLDYYNEDECDENNIEENYNEDNDNNDDNEYPKQKRKSRISENGKFDKKTLTFESQYDDKENKPNIAFSNNLQFDPKKDIFALQNSQINDINVMTNGSNGSIFQRMEDKMKPQENHSEDFNNQNYLNRNLIISKNADDDGKFKLTLYR